MINRSHTSLIYISLSCTNLDTQFIAMCLLLHSVTCYLPKAGECDTVQLGR